MRTVRILTDAQLRAELEKCEYCEERPCQEGCPARCSPTDFIMASQVGEPQDIRRAAAEIMMANPFGGVCGMVCPDTHCMARCTHHELDGPVDIPSVQATIVQRAKDLGGLPELPPVEPAGHRVAVVGAGPAGLAAAAMLARHGVEVEVFDENPQAGGTCRWIPPHRLPREILDSDVAWQAGLGPIRVHTGERVADPVELMEDGGFDAAVVAIGLTDPLPLKVEGESLAISGLRYLQDPEAWPLAGRVAVVGGGATAVDCAVTARKAGAPHVELVCLERWDEMPLTPAERAELQEHGIGITERSRLTWIAPPAEDSAASLPHSVARVELERVTLPPGVSFHPSRVEPVPWSACRRGDLDHVVVAIGARAGLPRTDHARLVYAGDCRNGPTTVVEASASGKNAALEVLALLRGDTRPTFEPHVHSAEPLPGWNREPVSLACTFFGRPIPHPFLLSAAPPTDGYEQMKAAYEAGWAGGVMKTAFDGGDIHIPGEYMHVFEPATYGNCDNVSGHPLSRVCQEVSRLVAEFPDRLTMASTGGPVTGDDTADARAWQANCRKLQEAGAMGIEYSLSCPQGGDGTEGDIVAQSPQATAKIVDWVLQVADPEVPQLFKLTAAVTAIEPVIDAIAEVIERHPGKKAGVTLANTFPTVAFRERSEGAWDEGIVVGMSGRGVAPISNFTLSRAGGLGVPISGNGGPMDYKAAAHFLALGCETVQFCTIATRHGYGIVKDLRSGLSHLLRERGIASVADLVGRAQPEPVTDFMALSSEKQISDVDPDLCLHCGNCTRCPYLAVALNEDRVPETDPARCIGCGICVKKCFSGALFLRERTAEEAELLQEA